jgi:oxygen-independent coproporphyrinogen-3 oxidase
LIYWRGGDWWGFGPGAHSHVGGVRWWNVKHPNSYARRLHAGQTPAHGRELLAPHDRLLEQIMLGLRLAEGLDTHQLGQAARPILEQAAADGLLVGAALDEGRAVLTLRGRLLADMLTLRLVGCCSRAAGS